MDDNQRVTKSFDFAADVTKQLIALSTAIITLCVAFTDKIFSSDTAQLHSTALLISLCCFVLSIVLGILTLMALAGHLGKPTIDDGTTNQSPIYKGNVRFFSIGQMLMFVVAIIVAMVYVWKASSYTAESQPFNNNPEKCLKVIRVSEYSFEKGQVVDTLYLKQ